MGFHQMQQSTGSNLNIAKSIFGFSAWFGVWVCFCAIADYVINIESNAWAMAYGVLAKIVADQAQYWIEK